MDWVEDEVVLVEDEALDQALDQGLVLELVRAEALHRVLQRALDRVLDLALAQDEAPEVVVAEERPQQPWAHRTRSVREVKRRR